MSKQNIEKVINSYLGTTFKHQGRVKKNAQNNGGVDCLGLIVLVLQELEIKIEDYKNYSTFPDGLLLKAELDKLLIKTPVEELMVGDILLFRIKNNPQHLAIVSKIDGGKIFFAHAYQPEKKVVENSLDAVWRNRLVGAYKTLKTFA
ncbi:MAG: NlpC/P60 family protein [Alphaproteobacteria bacterium]|jgi:hypothetical protein